MTRARLVVLCGVAAIIMTMALIIVGYLLNTYRNATLLVAGLATLIVATTIAIPYWAAQRMCARKAERVAGVRQD